jgi:hypothetical protein
MLHGHGRVLRQERLQRGFVFGRSDTQGDAVFIPRIYTTCRKDRKESRTIPTDRSVSSFVSSPREP